jgi:hypothetical protein
MLKAGRQSEKREIEKSRNRENLTRDPFSFAVALNLRGGITAASLALPDNRLCLTLQRRGRRQAKNERRAFIHLRLKSDGAPVFRYDAVIDD